MLTRNQILITVFAAIVLAELIALLFDFMILEYIAKPLIMIWIAVYFLLNSQKRSFIVPVIIAFTFSWIGDMLLMLNPIFDNELLFFAGVGGFFVAQCLYIFVFLKFAENKAKGFLVRSPLWTIPLIVYLVGLFLFLLPGLEGLMLPIILIYAISLVGMSLVALNRKGRVGYSSFILVFIGALLFLISDSLIAINKFYFEAGLAEGEIPQAGFWIMLTYISAQYWIMHGLILEKSE